MIPRPVILPIAATALCLAACTSGGGPAKCSLNGGTQLLDTTEAAWPKYRRDMANTARIDGVDLTSNPGDIRWIFPDDATTLGPITTSPILGTDGRVYLLGRTSETISADLKIFVLDPSNGAILVRTAAPTPALSATPGATPTPGPPVVGNSTGTRSSPILGQDGSVFIVLETGMLRQFDTDWEEAFTASLGGFLAGSPNIGADGTVYVGTMGGVFSAVCPNGIPRFSLSTASTQSSPAVVSESYCNASFDQEKDCPRILFAGEDGQVRAVDLTGRTRWSLFTSSRVPGAVVVDEANERFFVADSQGLVLAGRLSDGSKIDEFRGVTGARVTTSPALGREKIYVTDEGLICSVTNGRSCRSDRDCVSTEESCPDCVQGETCADGTCSITVTRSCGSDRDCVPAAEACTDCEAGEICRGGMLYALSAETGAVQWTFEASGPIHSSPAVATGTGGDVIVFGADDARVYAVRDEGDEATLLWSIDVDAPVGASSPSIGFDGTVYVGTEGGRLYAIGAPVATSTPTETPSHAATPTASATATPETV